ncbi:MAG: phosphoenolpyruvate-utilizing N-terminal domain-containing protein, partial [Haloferacaceae archaeon]|nr:phosphoenolpyruvate-utilizing N-terminal domain-containing protein [Haloferacaceae archaeon]
MPLEGIGTTPRVGVGPAHWVMATTAAGATASAGAPDEERGRLATATDTVAAALEAAAADAAATLGEEEAAIFEAQQLFLTDPTVTEAMDEAIADGASAEAAVATAFDALIEQFEAMDGRMAERADDLRDVRSRLLGALGGATAPTLSVPDGAVVLAERLTPAETIGLEPEAVAGIATVTGNPAEYRT